MSRFRRIASRIDDGLDLARMQFRRLRGLERVVARPHRGFGTARRLIVGGHVVKGDESSPGTARPVPPGTWDNLRATLRRYIESEIMGARLTLRHGQAEVAAVTDSDGFFEVALPVALPPSDQVVWHAVDVTLESWPGARGAAPRRVSAEVMVPPAGARFGIISDMDDTVLRTGIGAFRRNWRQVIESDPMQREAFPGLPELYRVLTHDRKGVQRQPIFYVSSAAWGFYDLFTRFLDLKEIPQGPIFLKNYGLDETKWFAGGHGLHKTAAVERLFDVYPEMRFILIGDSGQDDAMIYRRIVANHPDRVLAVWIRDVSHGDARRAEIAALIDEVNEAGVPAAFGPDLLGAAREAAAAGWIPAAAVDQVEAAVAEAAAGTGRGTRRPAAGRGGAGRRG